MNCGCGSSGRYVKTAAAAGPAPTPEETVAAICEDSEARTDMASCLISADEGNQLVVGAEDQALFVPPAAPTIAFDVIKLGPTSRVDLAVNPDYTTLDYDEVRDDDSDGAWNGSDKFIAKVAGWYQFNAFCYFWRPASLVDEYVGAAIALNHATKGSFAHETNFLTPSAAPSPARQSSLDCSGLIKMAVGDEVIVQANASHAGVYATIRRLNGIFVGP